ncbi:MAG: response regulator [Desulfobacterales bacterium]|nr:response regulator [Desulfobacterales bacterium]MCP4159288.1 response regulator [Deltaproteobacteria bacterium]
MAKILIIDDEALIRSLLKKSLKPYGQIVVTEDGNDGLSAYEDAVMNKNEFDIIFLDIMMERKTGLEVLREIRSREKSREVERKNGVKIIMITGNAEAAIVKECITAGCDKFIVKPFVLETLAKTIESLGFNQVSS